MAATTMTNLLDSSYHAVDLPEQRIAALESQVEGLLKWQQSFISALSFTLSTGKNQNAHKCAYKSKAETQINLASIEKRLPDRDLVVTVTETTPKIPDDPKFNAPATDDITTPVPRVTDTSTPMIDIIPENVSTAPTTPASEAPPSDESEKISVQNSNIPLAPETECTIIAYKVMDVIQRYGQHLESGPGSPKGVVWAGRAKFAPKVESHIAAGQTIKMILPSFPWKSINRIDKVTGALPDFGEELALSRLDNLCRDIAEVYQHGAEITIATDGLAFNDLVGITDEDTWEYSAALKSMATTKGFHALKLVRIMDLLGMTDERPTTKESYLETVNPCRKELESQFGRPKEAIREMIQSDADTLLTYRGFIRFLETDLRHSPIVPEGTSRTQFRKVVKQVAEGMMCRAESFTKIIQAKCPNYIRLSIHPSSGAAKLSVPLIPQTSGVFPKSPWHCSVAVGIDGSYTTVHSKDVRESHSPVLVNDRPYFFREKSPLYDWADGRAEMEHLYPRGLLVRARTDIEDGRILRDAEVEILKDLAMLQPSVLIQGFTNAPDGKISPRIVVPA